jgi:hypothetical protein
MLGSLLTAPSWTCDILANNYPEGCWSVCGREYTTSTSAAPICNQGGRVKSYEEAQYSCSARTCGTLANYVVAIQVLHGDDIIKEDTTTTDDDGQFSYTLTAPNLDDEVSIIVKVVV